jgi:hypothetical protein
MLAAVWVSVLLNPALLKGDPHCRHHHKVPCAATAGRERRAAATEQAQDDHLQDLPGTLARFAQWLLSAKLQSVIAALHLVDPEK